MEMKAKNKDMSTLDLNKKVEDDGLRIEPAILEYIAVNVKSNIRELEGSLNKLIALSKLKKRKKFIFYQEMVT